MHEPLLETSGSLPLQNLIVSAAVNSDFQLCYALMVEYNVVIMFSVCEIMINKNFHHTILRNP